MLCTRVYIIQDMHIRVYKSWPRLTVSIALGSLNTMTTLVRLHHSVWSQQWLSYAETDPCHRNMGFPPLAQDRRREWVLPKCSRELGDTLTWLYYISWFFFLMWSSLGLLLTDQFLPRKANRGKKKTLFIHYLTYVTCVWFHTWPIPCWDAACMSQTFREYCVGSAVEPG